MNEFRIPLEREFPEGRLRLRASHLVSEIDTNMGRGPAAHAHRDPARRRLLATIPAIAAALVAVLVVGTSLLPGTTAAAQALNKAADTAAQQRSAVAGPGEYSYTKTLAYSANEDTQGILASRTIQTESWVAANGSGTQVTEISPPEFFNQEDRRTWTETFGPIATRPEVQRSSLDGSSDSVYDVGALPTDPDKLATLIEDRKIIGGPSGDWETFQEVWELLGSPNASPELRSTLFQVAAGIDGVVLSGDVTDPVGRAGFAVSLTSDKNGPLTQIVVFDKSSSQLLATEEVDAKTGAVYSADIVLEAGVVASDTSTPVDSELVPAPVATPQFEAPAGPGPGSASG